MIRTNYLPVVVVEKDRTRNTINVSVINGSASKPRGRRTISISHPYGTPEEFEDAFGDISVMPGLILLAVASGLSLINPNGRRYPRPCVPNPLTDVDRDSQTPT